MGKPEGITHAFSSLRIVQGSSFPQVESMAHLIHEGTCDYMEIHRHQAH